MPSQTTGTEVSDPIGWRPMWPYRGRRRFEIRDPVIEPYWKGARVLVHVSGAAAETGRPGIIVCAEDGTDLSDEVAGLTAAIDACVLAGDAVLDGILSRQVGLDGVGAAPIAEMRERPGLLRNRTDLDVQARGSVQELAAAEEGFVAVDLLRIDGTALLDVPLLERKRLLEGVVRPHEKVIIGVYVRPPIETWVATWKSVGFRGGMLKAANSRYRPGEDTTEWRIVEDVARRHG